MYAMRQSLAACAPSAQRIHRPHFCCSSSSRHAPAPRPRRGAAAAAPAAAAAASSAASADAAAASTSFTSCEPAAAALTDAQQQQEWASCCQTLEGLGFTAADADKFVARAFGWGSQAYWRGDQVNVPPSQSQVAGVLGFLSDLGLLPAELKKVVKAFPEVLGCDVAGQLQKNTARLTSEWKLSGAVLAKAVARTPSVLGYTIDCMGDCAGECNRCWVRF